MPLPKRRHSRTRGRKRRTHWKLSAPNVSECPHCHQPRLPHHVCTHCGYYNGRPIIQPKEA
ncbi:MAG TPA: 50S ribosomal protein L32 [candidate division Zixibacteria bacterium]|nr:50S ribosomal protein L32 [candidate division Zixibacteria bacterium]MDD4918792.1 50S ribosomal protein L32 [candidate division Zixibacteria bacterium]MDM7973011.1 50S ribosomal protein L32 [candidate division Zixibacteria bacterium]HOD65978.1 50S ribosomal protein L32 [candidate division Zixibacteria bacterium]HOZ07736.1 50S ribosomal protein L32 [candidate division Zixibacteria bacterium]